MKEHELAPFRGFRFECTGCGACCRRPGWVYLSGEEVKRIAAWLGIEPRQFRKRHLVRVDGLWAVEVPEGGACPFLDEQSRCTIQEVKPGQCASYPFWMELIEDREAWDEEARLCEGMGRGEELPPEVVLRFAILDPTD